MATRIRIKLDKKIPRRIRTQFVDRSSIDETTSKPLTIEEMLKLADKVKVWEHKSESRKSSACDDMHNWEVYTGSLDKGFSVIFDGYVKILKIISPNGNKIGSAYAQEDKRLQQLWDKIDGERKKKVQLIERAHQDSESGRFVKSIKDEVKIAKELIRT